MIAFNAVQGACFLLDGKEPGREEILLNGASMYDYYETKDGRYVSFGGLEPKFFSAFCQKIGRPDLSDGGVMPKDCAKIKEEVRMIIKGKTMDEWITLFNTTDACLEPVLTLSEALGGPLVHNRKMVVDVPGPGGKKIKQIANPIKFSESAPEYRYVGVPVDGANTIDIMKSLGYTGAEIEEFAKTGLFN